GQMTSTIRQRFIASGRAAEEGRVSRRPLSVLSGTVRAARGKLVVFADQMCVFLAICVLVITESLTSASSAPVPRSALGDKLIALLRDSYPEITFLTHDEVKPERYYATYSMGLFFDDKDNVFQPCDFRHVGLHRPAGYILGVDPTEKPPRISLADDG